MCERYWTETKWIDTMKMIKELSYHQSGSEKEKLTEKKVHRLSQWNIEKLFKKNTLIDAANENIFYPKTMNFTNKNKFTTLANYLCFYHNSLVAWLFCVHFMISARDTTNNLIIHMYASYNKKYVLCRDIFNIQIFGL